MSTELPWEIVEEDGSTTRLLDPPIIAELEIKGESVSVLLELSVEARAAIIRAMGGHVHHWHEDSIRAAAEQPWAERAFTFEISNEAAKLLQTTLAASEYVPKRCDFPGCQRNALPLADQCALHLREERMP